jgi:hypothetical protein
MDIEGKQLPEGEFEVERWMAYLWADATRNENDAFRYEEEAAASGEPAQLVPPELGQLIIRDGGGARPKEALSELEPDYDKGVYHGEQEFEFHQPLYVDETYRVTGEVTDVERKEGRSGPFDLATMRFDVFDSDEDLAFVAKPRMVLMR